MRFPLVIAALVLAGMPALAAPQLRTQVTVDRDTVLLGDLFSGLPDGAAATAEVARAPAAGRTTSIDAGSLLSIAGANGIAWKPQSRFEKIVVERAAQAIGYDTIKATLIRAMTAQGLAADTDIVLDNEQLRILLATDRQPTLGIEQLSFAPSRDRFSATLVAPAGEPNAERVRIQGRVLHTTEVAVPVRSIQAGEVIRARDLQMVRLRRDQVGKTHLTDTDHLVGRSARRPLGANQPVRASDLVMPNLVTRNGTVIVKVASDRMSLAMQAKVLDDGVAGDVVRVQNLRSSKIIQGTVTGPGEVTVNTAYSLAAK